MLSAISRWTPTCAMIAGIAYLAGHVLTGESGLFAWTDAKTRIAALEVELAEAQADRGDLEDRARRLRPETLDRDYVEERARALLAMGHPRDIVVPAASLETR